MLMDLFDYGKMNSNERDQNLFLVLSRDRRMHPQSLWQINPQVHPVTHCSFDQQTLICALTPLCKHPDMVRRVFFFTFL